MLGFTLTKENVIGIKQTIGFLLSLFMLMSLDFGLPLIALTGGIRANSLAGSSIWRQ